MEFFSKILTETDIRTRLEVPIGSLQRFNFPEGHRSVDLEVMDWGDRVWRLRLGIRRQKNHRRPAMTGDWLLLVREKGLQIGDRVTFSVLDGGNYRIDVHRIRIIRLFGTEAAAWAPVDN